MGSAGLMLGALRLVAVRRQARPITLVRSLGRPLFDWFAWKFRDFQLQTSCRKETTGCVTSVK